MPTSWVDNQSAHETERGGALRRVSFIQLVFVSFCSTSSEPGHQAFIDTMNMFDNNLSYKELIQNVLYVRLIVSLTVT